jgi:nucleotidyltransferase/DNA polymerase involved in DNA repair
MASEIKEPVLCMKNNYSLVLSISYIMRVYAVIITAGISFRALMSIPGAVICVEAIYAPSW